MIELNDNHRRVIGTTLSLLDQMLCEFEGWASGRRNRSVLYAETNTLTAEQSRAIVERIAAIRKLLAPMREDLSLESRTQDAGTAIWANCVSFWETLAETESRQLVGYGEPSQSLADYLDPRIGRLTEELAKIAAIAKGKLPGSPLPAHSAGS